MGDDNSNAPRAEEPEAGDQSDVKQDRLRYLRAVGFTSLAIVLYLLLADAAVETFISGSDVRWLVAAVVVTYLASAAVLWWRGHPLWRRKDWKARATISLFVFLGLLTITTWVPGGIADGVRLLGQATSTLLIIITGTAVALSGMTLMRVRYPHPAVKWVIAVLAIYAVTAFLRALPAVTLYPDLFRGGSDWRWLPRWVQGAFIGAFVLVPAGILSHLVGGVLPMIRRELHTRGVQALALSMSLAISAAGLNMPRETVQAQGKMSDRGPGLRRQPLDALTLPVPRTFDLTHVDPAHFAEALGKDPNKIFEFVRDNIAYEAYAGVLRGSRGTLLAMAGNSVDRAALLGTMLERSGQRVRYARGTLDDANARELVLSMWAKRPSTGQLADGRRPSSRAENTARTLTAAISRNYELVLRILTPGPAGGAVATTALSSLVQQSREHYWVQWSKSGSWIDLDPSFAEASPGRQYARVEETFDQLPEALFHRVNLRLKVEEYTGAIPATRDVLTYSVKAADLSGADLILIHEPENWKGPVRNIQGAIASAIEDTGRVKPVLIDGKKVLAGGPFRLRLKTSGIGGIQSLLSGEGTRTPVTEATAEWIELEFLSPDGQRETVNREVFDVVGKARRTAGRTLTADEVQRLAEKDQALNVAGGVYSLFFSTGRIYAGHFANVVSDVPAAEGGASAVGRYLRRINIAFAAISDMLTRRIETRDGEVILFYPDEARVFITDIAAPSGTPRIVLDLRRDHAHGVALGPRPEALRSARIFRGILDGTLEWALIDYVTVEARQKKTLDQMISTISIFEQAQAAHVPILLLPQESSRLDSAMPLDALARIREETSLGYLVVAPQRALSVGGTPRFAWWQIDPRSGETTAVTDDGLHAAEEVYVVESEDSVALYEVGGRGQVTKLAEKEATRAIADEVTDLLVDLDKEGVNVRGPLRVIKGGG